MQLFAPWGWIPLISNNGRWVWTKSQWFPNAFLCLTIRHLLWSRNSSTTRAVLMKILKRTPLHKSCMKILLQRQAGVCLSTNKAPRHGFFVRLSRPIQSWRCDKRTEITRAEQARLIKLYCCTVETVDFGLGAVIRTDEGVALTPARSERSSSQRAPVFTEFVSWIEV